MNAYRTFLLVLCTVLLASMPLSTGAMNQATSGDIKTSGWTYYTNQRQITHSPYGIAFNKTDGPKMQMRWYGCGGWYGTGTAITLPNADPTGYIQIGPGVLPSGLIFCMGGIAQGNNPTDTFSGNIDWDGIDI